jgi:8-oxo-dGTP diphosphatase
LSVGHGDTIYLMRHAKAGERRLWTGEDIERPLSKRGFKQADAVAARLAKKGATVVYSSPYVRCVQSVQPLADLLGVPIRIDPRLSEDEPFEPVLDLLGDVEDGAVLCSHGDIIPATIRALQRRGMLIETPADWSKSSVWVLRRNATHITKGKVWPPPL